MRISIPLVRLRKARLGANALPSREVHSWKVTLRRSVNSHWFRALTIGFAALLIHAPALQGQRIWDDQYLSRDNPFIKSPLLILEAFRHYLFLDSISPHYRPVQNLSFVFDYFFWNTDEFGFHLTNVLLHAGSGILLYFLLRRLFASFFFRDLSVAARDRTQTRLPWISQSAFLVSLIWTAHPVHSAAVDYISGRADSLAFFFAAAGWLLFLRAEKISRSVWRVPVYALASVNGLFALLSREIGCIWIVLFVAHLVCLEKGIAFRRRVGAIVCCILLFAIYAGLRQLPGERATAAPQAGWSMPVRAVLMARSLGDYTRLMVFPANLHMERTVVDPTGWRTNADWRRTIPTEYLSILGLFLFGIFVYGAVKKGHGRILRIFGSGWFVVSYLPISNMVQLNATVAEHWLYLPVVGFLIFLFGCAVELPIRYRRFATTFALLALVGLSVRSFIRSGDWADEEIFYRRTLAAGGESSRVSTNLAQVYARRGDYETAEKMLRQILQRTPDYPTARINLGNILLHEGKADEAEKLFRSLFKTDAQISKDYPRTWIAAVNLACVRHKAGDDNAAFSILDSARAAHPGVWELVCYEAELRRQTEGAQAALPLIERFAQKNWWHYGSAVALGRLYAELGDVARADVALSHASWLDVHDAEALHLIALIKLRENHLDEAFRAQRRAVSRQPDQPRQYILLSNILEKMGRTDEAQAAMAQVLRLRALAENSSSRPL